MDENIGTMLAQVSRLLRRSFDARARGIGVTRPQWQVLSLLTFHAGINQGGLADLLEVEPITLGRMIDRLQDAQLVERRPDPTDRRAWRLFLTDKGQMLLDQLRPFALETYDTALEGISADEQAALLVALGRMRANLSRRQSLDANAAPLVGRNG
jgi:DNA-binding MarR family transcriptional regulator